MSFAQCRFLELDAQATASGFLATAPTLNGIWHKTGSTTGPQPPNWPDAPNFVYDLSTYDWSASEYTDAVGFSHPPSTTGAPYGAGSFSVSIPWQIHVNGFATNSAITFATVIQSGTSDSTGTASIQKGGSGYFTAAANSPTVVWPQ